MKSTSTLLSKTACLLFFLIIIVATSFAKPENGFPSNTPIKITSFTATVKENVIIPAWQTEQQDDNGYFEVERSFDAVSFKTAGLVLGAEIINGLNASFRFKDKAADLGDKSIAYYRLKHIDNAGNVMYSSVLTVNLPSNKIIRK